MLEQSTHSAGDGDRTLGARETDRLSPPLEAVGGGNAGVMTIDGDGDGDGDGDDDDFIP